MVTKKLEAAYQQDDDAVESYDDAIDSVEALLDALSLSERYDDIADALLDISINCDDDVAEAYYLQANQILNQMISMLQ